MTRKHTPTLWHFGHRVWVLARHCAQVIRHVLIPIIWSVLRQIVQILELTLEARSVRRIMLGVYCSIFISIIPPGDPLDDPWMHAPPAHDWRYDLRHDWRDWIEHRPPVWYLWRDVPRLPAEDPTGIRRAALWTVPYAQPPRVTPVRG